MPPGRYRLVAWHERAPTPRVVAVTVPERGATGIDVALAAQPVTTRAHLNKFGQRYPATERDEY